MTRIAGARAALKHLTSFRAAHQCRDKRADPVAEKQMANFCEYFDFIRRLWAAKAEGNAREASARENLKKLFGD